MDYKKVLRLHYVNKLSYREIADSCSDCSKSAVGEFLKRFKGKRSITTRIDSTTESCFWRME